MTVALNASLSLAVRYIGPGNTANNSSMSVALTYEQSAAGYIDVPADVTMGTDFVIPFGTVTDPKCIVIQNLSGQDLDVTFGAAMAPSFTLPTGGVSMPLFASAVTTLAGLKLTSTADGSAEGQISYIVLG